MPNQTVMILIAVLITLVIAVPVSCLAAVSYRKKIVESKLGSAEEKARQIIDDALKTAETKKREALLEAKRRNDLGTVSTRDSVKL